MKRIVRGTVLLRLLFPAAASRASEPFAIRPSETDRRIDSFDSPHMVWLPDGQARNQLLVFLPGTGGSPSIWIMEAASAGG
ncbi:MAG TPA: hypothetical protein VMW17_21930 [Candidatus Binatia bacterium]|nr:hypothetical protein [Candidatus Binatia bacterium]